MRQYLRFLLVVPCVVLVALALLFGELGFTKVLDFRKLERIPLTTITGSVGGEAQLKGKALVHQRFLQGPKSNAKTLYYRYTVEREERDSDGNTSWRTIEDVQSGVDFLLEDRTDTVRVLSAPSTYEIEWSVPRKFFREQGKYRYKEWRVDPGDQVTVFGWLDHGPEPVLSFSKAGQYLPIVSGFGSASERGDIGAAALGFLWAGVTCLIAACLLLVGMLRIHRTLVFLSIVSFAAALLLVHYGYQSLEKDVEYGYDSVLVQQARTESLIRETLGAQWAGFEGLDTPFNPAHFAFDEATVEKVNEWRIGSYLVRERYMHQIHRFPEILYATMTGRASPPEVVLPQDLKAIADQRAATYASTRVGTQVVLTLAGLLLIAGLAWFALRFIRVKRMQENLPTSKTAGVTYGLAEVTGMLVREGEAKMLKGPVSGVICTWYRYKVEKRVSSGKNTSWETVSDEVRKQPFLCEDDEGAIRVFPTQAEVITSHTETNRVGDMRYSEWRLSPGDELYILGKARMDKTRADHLVFGHEKGIPYIISNLPESVVMLRKALTGMALFSVGISLLFLCAIWIGGSNGQFSSLDFLLAAMVAPLFLIVVMFVLMYNDLVFLKQRCERNWANIQVSLKKRANVIPRLETIVKEYLAHESHLQQGLALLRERSRASDTEEAVDQYMAIEHESIAELNARIEDYPDLKGIDLVSDLNERLIKLENEVALIRAGFNNAVMQYQTRKATFPDNILARIFGFKDLTRLSFDKSAHALPEVKL